MPTLTLRECFINLMSTGEYVKGMVGPDRPRIHSIDGDVQTFAGGRRRSITTAGEITSVPVRFPLLTAADVLLLRTWKGQLIEFRDQEGLQVYGTFFDVPLLTLRDTGNIVTLVIQGTSFVEGI